ncbi:MAG TPA: hypothetical protein V6C76_06965 [Drouetiella sp.]
MTNLLNSKQIFYSDQTKPQERRQSDGLGHRIPGDEGGCVLLSCAPVALPGSFLLAVFDHRCTHGIVYYH